VPELEDQLLSLGDSIVWPATPNLRVAVGPTLTLLSKRGGERVTQRVPRWVLAAAALLLVVLLLAFTWLNLHTLIYRVPNPPTPTQHSPGVLGSNLDLGKATSLTDAQAQLQWKVVVPPGLGKPNAVYVKLPPSGPSGGEVTLVYAAAPGVNVSGQTGVAVLVTEARGTVNEIYFEKMIGPGATVEQVTVHGHSGYWISGHPHDFLFVSADGTVHDDAMRLATNTLILDDGGTIVRIEGDMTKAQALQIAGSI
jgi:hypothetical protein